MGAKRLARSAGPAKTNYRRYVEPELLLRYRVAAMNSIWPIKAAKSKDVTCPDCHGSGRHLVTDIQSREKDLGDCRTCGGTGKVPLEEAAQMREVRWLRETGVAK